MSNIGSGGFPTSHTTSTTTKVTPLIWFDKSYIQTIPGLLKASAIIIDLIAFIIAQFGSSSSGRVGFFSFTSMMAFWLTLILLALYCLHVVEKLQSLPWLLGEFAFCLIWTAFYFLSSLLMLIDGGVHSAAGVFGFIAFAIYGYDAFIKYQGYSAGEIAQGDRERTTIGQNNA
ncbi:proteolipid protein 2-like [Oppia nitens]|uniref:proteolipid protein 2-like n=1 Tax=Oppia nitens TaxID=1686743 RepID=UPI0023DA38D1|nr:proteolipid protein 2-like [Oppia nitens]XP_054164638.1 proteolipid protein 2-like [Oppia nitens]XP_054164640.1 proteolipid protein 2-like [Oppia nitens]XP_054164641.1 proteolipid protein 2-like [Oppia nitens]